MCVSLLSNLLDRTTIKSNCCILAESTVADSDSSINISNEKSACRDNTSHPNTSSCVMSLSIISFHLANIVFINESISPIFIKTIHTTLKISVIPCKVTSRRDRHACSKFNPRSSCQDNTSYTRQQQQHQ